MLPAGGSVEDGFFNYGQFVALGVCALLEGAYFGTALGLLEGLRPHESSSSVLSSSSSSSSWAEGGAQVFCHEVILGVPGDLGECWNQPEAFSNTLGGPPRSSPPPSGRLFG